MASHASSLLLQFVLTLPTLNSAPPSPAVVASFDHVRAVDEVADSIIADARRQSPTLSSLVGQINARRVVVYVASTLGCKGRGSLRFVTHAAGMTYLSVCVNPRQMGSERAATLGHELQHAIEVASAVPKVTSASDFSSLYRRIGIGIGPRAYETSAAMATERVVRLEYGRRFLGG